MRIRKNENICPDRTDMEVDRVLNFNYLLLLLFLSLE